jgi:hypothetical protein
MPLSSSRDRSAKLWLFGDACNSSWNAVALLDPDQLRLGSESREGEKEEELYLSVDLDIHWVHRQTELSS